MIPSVLRDRRYLALYLHRFLAEFSFAPTYVLMGAFMLQRGLPLWSVLLFYGLQFGLCGFLSAWAPRIIHMLGPLRAVLLANVSQTIFLLALVLGPNVWWTPFAALIFFALYGAIYWPYADVLEAAYVEDHHRGVQYAISSTAVGLGGALGYAAFATLNATTSMGISLLVFGFVMPLSVIPLAFLDFSRLRGKPITPPQAFQEVASDEFRPMVLPMLGQQLTIICSGIVAPLFIYHVVGETSEFGFLIAATILIKLAVCLLLGHDADRFGHQRSAKIIVGGNVLSSVLFLAVPPSAKALLGIESLNRVSFTTLTNSFATFLHRKLAPTDKDLLRFGVAWQIVLCAGEVIALPLLALAAWIWGWPALYLGFILNMLGAWMTMRPMFVRQKK